MSGDERSEQDKTALLVSYAAGTAAEQERAEVEAMIATDPDAAARLALARSSKQALEAMGEGEQDGWTPGEIGLRRLMRDIDREAERRSLQWADSVALWRGVAAAAVLALVVMSAFRIGGEGRGGLGGYEIASGRTEGLALAQVTFAPSATEAEIRSLLVGAGARIVDGPSALGVYRLAFETDAARDDAVAMMTTARAVENVSAE